MAMVLARVQANAENLKTKSSTEIPLFMLLGVEMTAPRSVDLEMSAVSTTPFIIRFTVRSSKVVARVMGFGRRRELAWEGE